MLNIIIHNFHHSNYDAILTTSGPMVITTGQIRIFKSRAGTLKFTSNNKSEQSILTRINLWAVIVLLLIRLLFAKLCSSNSFYKNI